MRVSKGESTTPTLQPSNADLTSPISSLVDLFSLLLRLRAHSTTMATTCNVMAAAGVRSSSAQMRAQPARSANLLMLAPKRVASRQSVRVFASGNGTALAVKEAQAKSIDKVEKQYLSERASQINKHFETALGKLGGHGGMSRL